MAFLVSLLISLQNQFHIAFKEILIVFNLDISPMFFFKIAHVTALWKHTGLKSDPNMYRPIALLSTLSKSAGSIIHNRLSSHFIENNIITSRQAAYVKGDSTIHQLLYIVNLIRKSWTKAMFNSRNIYRCFVRF